jgi:hypothetical protein
MDGTWSGACYHRIHDNDIVIRAPSIKQRERIPGVNFGSNA